MQPLARRLSKLAVHGQHVEVAPKRADVNGDSLQRTAPTILRPKIDCAGRHALRDCALSCPNPDKHRELEGKSTTMRRAKNESYGRGSSISSLPPREATSSDAYHCRNTRMYLNGALLNNSYRKEKVDFLFPVLVGSTEFYEIVLIDARRM